MSISIVLQTLIDDYGMSPMELSRRSTVPQPTVHRLLNGLTKKPNNATTQALCCFFKVNANQLLGFEPLNLSREIGSHRTVPLLAWHDIPDFPNNLQNIGCYEKTISTDAPTSAASFALISNDSSMEPLFPQDTILVFDSCPEPRDRSFVIAYIASDNKAIFRQLIIDGNAKFLKSLNPDISSQIIRKLLSDDCIIGTLIQAKKNYYL